jgi:hypothetical protein
MSFEERFLSEFTLQRIRESYLYSRVHRIVGERRSIQTEYTESILSDIIIIRTFNVLKVVNGEVYNESFTVDFCSNDSPLSYPEPSATRVARPLPPLPTRLSPRQRERRQADINRARRQADFDRQVASRTRRASVEHSSRSTSGSPRLRYPSLRPTATSPAPSPAPFSPIVHATPIDYSQAPEYVNVIELTRSDSEEL